MKHILILILSLASFAGYSQTVGQFRYDTTKFLKIGGRNHVMIENLIQTSDSTVKPLVVGADGVIKRNSYWPGGSGGGSGSIEYILQGYGIKIDSTGRLYTVSVDTAEINNIIAGDTTIFETTLDSTGQPNNRILFSRNRKISSSPRILIDSANSRVIINNANVSAGGANNKLFVGGQATVTGNMIVQSVPLSNDSTTYKPMVIGADGVLRKAGYWRTGSGGSGVTKAQVPLLINVAGDSITRRWNVMDYVGAGYTPGVTDATPAFIAALSAANTGGGGKVIVPIGVYNIAGALDAGCNCQIPIPTTGILNAGRTYITIEGESRPHMAPVGGGLDVGGTSIDPTTGVILKSSLTAGIAGSAVIGSAQVTSSFNYTNLSVENIAIQVKNNPTGAGPVIGGINAKYLAAINTNWVTVYIDTSAYVSVYPVNDIAGIETPNGGAETYNSIANTNVIGFRSGYKIGEHTVLNQAQGYCNFYTFNIKDAAHSVTSVRSLSQWSVYAVYISGAYANLNNFSLNTEWQQIGKWFDDVATVKDSANRATGNIVYTIDAAGVGIDNTKYIKSGGSNISDYPHSTNPVNLNAANTFPEKQTIGTSGTNPYMFTIRKSNSDGSTNVPGIITENPNTTAATGADYNFSAVTVSTGNGAVQGQLFANYGTGATAPFSLGSGVYTGSRTNHPLVLFTNNEERLRINDGVDAVALTGNNSGRISYVAQNLNSAGNTSFYFQNNTGGYADYGGLGHWGTAASGSWLGATRASKTFMITDGNSTGMLIGSLNSSPVVLGTNNTAGVTVSTAQLVRFHAYGAGTLVTDGSGNITASSSKFVKHSILSLKYGLDEIKRVEPSTYIRDADSTNTVEPGFIAENIQDVFGGLGVGKSKDGVLSLNTNIILAAAVNAIKELSERVEKLEAEIKLLKK